jgi:hypothetical protein
MHYDGVTGDFLGEFVTSESGGMIGPAGLTFGPDGNLYVANWESCNVTRFQGPTGPAPGAPMPSAGNSGAVFIPGDGGSPWPGQGRCVEGGVIFGPDGNLYVTYTDWTGQYKGNHGTVRRFDGVTGAFIDDFVPPGSGGLENPLFLTFTETDPVTLAYTGATEFGSDAGSSAASGDLALLIAIEVAVPRDDTDQATGSEVRIASTEPVRNQLILPPDPAPASTVVTRATLATLLSDDDADDADSDPLIDDDLLTLIALTSNL